MMLRERSTDDMVILLTAQSLQDSLPPPPATLEERCKAAMKLARTDAAFMCTTDDQRFRGAIGAVLLASNDVDRAQINGSLDALKALSAAMNGVPVDFSQILGTDPAPLPLLGWWHETSTP